MIRSYTMMKTGSTTGTVCHQGKRIKPDHGPTPEDHDPRKLPLGPGEGDDLGAGGVEWLPGPAAVLRLDLEAGVGQEAGERVGVEEAQAGTVHAQRGAVRLGGFRVSNAKRPPLTSARRIAVSEARSSSSPISTWKACPACRARCSIAPVPQPTSSTDLASITSAR